MEPTGKKQAEPVFRLPSSVRGEIEWLLMCCDSEDRHGHLSAVIAQLLGKMPRVRLLIACGKRAFAMALHARLSAQPFQLSPVIVDDKSGWAAPNRCCLLAPMEEDESYKFEVHARDSFHVLHTADDGPHILLSEHGKQGRHDTMLADFLLKRMEETGFGPPGFIRKEERPALMVQGGNLLCDAGCLFVGVVQLTATPGGETALLDFANGGKQRDIWKKVVVVGKQVAPKIRSSLLKLYASAGALNRSELLHLFKLSDTLFLREIWADCEVPAHKGDVLPLHIDYFMTLTGVETDGPAPRPVVFVAKISNSLGLKNCAGGSLRKFVDRLNRRLSRVERQLKNAGFEVIRNQIPLVEWATEEGYRKVVPFPFNNCLVEVAQEGRVRTAYMARASTGQPLGASEQKKLRVMEEAWAAQWMHPSLGFEVRFIEANFFPFALGFSSLHCITKELSRHTDTSLT